MLIDAAQVAVFMAFLVDLALPWWTRSNSRYPPTGTATGRGSLHGGDSGRTWGALLAMAVVLVAAVFRVRWLSVTAAVVAIGLSLLEMEEAGRVHGFGPGAFDARAGLWLGYVIILLGAGLCLANVALAARLREIMPVARLEPARDT